MDYLTWKGLSADMKKIEGKKIFRNTKKVGITAVKGGAAVAVFLIQLGLSYDTYAGYVNVGLSREEALARTVVKNVADGAFLPEDAVNVFMGKITVYPERVCKIIPPSGGYVIRKFASPAGLNRLLDNGYKVCSCWTVDVVRVGDVGGK